MNKLSILFLFMFSQPISASTFFAPDGDTALLIQILGTEIQATAGILQILEISSESMKQAQKLHKTVDNVHTKAARAEYLARTITEFPKNKEEMRSMVNVRNNLETARYFYDERDTLTLGYDVLKTSGDLTGKAAVETTEQANRDRAMAVELYNDSMSAKTTAEGAVITSKAATQNLLQLSGINSSLAISNANASAQNTFLYLQMVQQYREEFYMKKRWGMIHPETTFFEYAGISPKRSASSKAQKAVK